MYTCQNARNVSPSAPLILWKWPTKPFQRIHIDLCQKGNDYYLVVIDSHSKWIELQHMSSTTTEWTINGLHLILATRGLFEEVVSDNALQFTSTKLAEFMRKNVTLSPSPYQRQTNGSAERSARVVKDVFVKQVLEGKKGIFMKHRFANVLFRYRTTPHSTTGMPPAELMVQRRLRKRLRLSLIWHTF